MFDAPGRGEDIRRAGVEWLPFMPPESVDVDTLEIEFLNRRRKIDIRDMNWSCSDESKLWRYNLHYFDYLHWDAYSIEGKGDLIDSWIDSNPVGSVDAWEPYTVSLRVVNWIKYFLGSGEGGEVSEPWQKSLAE